MISPAPALVDVEQVRAAVDAGLARHLQDMASELGPLGDDSSHLVDAVRIMLDGGKRLRAAFCYWSWRAHGGGEPVPPAAGRSPVPASRDQVLRVGAALELFQAAALFHDDVMDDSDTRRGRRAAHLRFADLHAAQGWSGSPRRFGDATAILLGDLALIASARELADAVRDLPRPVRSAVQRAFDGMRTEVTVGQFLDLVAQSRPWAVDPAADEARAREVIRAKSARYSVEHPIVLGALLAGATVDEVARCREIGLPLGEAFQLRDDILGVFGDPSATGKPAGDDLREGKRTVLVARALRDASPDDAALVHASLGDRGLGAQDIEVLRTTIRRSGAVDSVEELIGSLAGPALATLAAAPLHEPGRTMLIDLGHAAVDRTA
ncbi:MAG TPA: polyprenyl synthetase family protein [Actinotalea sp.]